MLFSTLATGNSSSIFLQLESGKGFLANSSDHCNGSSSHGNSTGRDEGEPEMSVHDIEYDMPLRKAILYVQIAIGILGAVLLFIYMMHARR